MLEKLPGVASADADKTTRSATIVYDKSVFDTSSLGDEGRYKFELREDSAADGDTSGDGGSNAKADAQASDSSKIQIDELPAEDATSGSAKKGDDNIVPSLDGPAS